MYNMLCISLFLVFILHREERLTVLYGELCDHRACPKYISVAPDVVAEDLRENAPVLQAPVDRLVARPDAALHLEVLGGVDVVLGALDLVRVPAVAIVGLDSLAGLEEVRENGGEDLDVRPLTGRVGSLDPYKLSREDVHPKLVAQGGLPRVLVGTEGIPFLRDPLLRDAKVRTVNGHQTVVSDVMSAEAALEVHLRFGEREGGRLGGGVRA